MNDDTENTENQEAQTSEEVSAVDAQGDSGDAMEEEDTAPSMKDHMNDILNGAGEGGLQPGLPTQEFSEDGGFSANRDLNAVYEVPVQLSAVLGKSTMPVHQLLKIGRGAVIELDRRVGEAIDIYVNNKLVARGEVVLVEDRLGVTMTEIIKADRV